MKTDIMTPKHRIGPLLTDLYQLTMAAAYYQEGIAGTATFSLFVRESAARNYFVAAGLETVLDELSGFGFSDGEVAYLKETGLFSDDFLSFLSRLAFTGDIFAMPEGAIFFADEPVLEVTAPIIEAQIVETFLLNSMGSQSLFASKGARCVHAAAGRPLIDFSLRRTQGPDAGVNVARSTYISGFAGTSNLLAGQRFGIPVSGTMAHSYVSAFEHEIDAFRAYAAVFPESSVFLIDTYDTLAGARQAARVGLEMREQGHSLKGVRLDSGDLVSLSCRVREILDNAGLPGVRIFASNGLDEFGIHELLTRGARIDAFGVGTKVGACADAPYMDVVYKLVKINDRLVRKLSPGKKTLAGEKQVFRETDARGMFKGDIIGLRDETIENATPLLSLVMRRGRPVGASPGIGDIQAAFRSNFKALPDRYKSIHERHPYPVSLSEGLSQAQGGVK
jgi:nicotinate phosphoribosyltransferase